MHKVIRLLLTSTLVTVTIGAQSAGAQSVNEKRIVRRGYTQLFTYDPANSGTVAASYVTKFSRLAAVLVQPHTVEKTACGYLFSGMQGLPLSTATYRIDISTDTKVTNKANLILIGIDGSGAGKVHKALGLNFDSSYPSAPGWITYNYSARTFSPAIGADETFGSLAVSLFGGDHKNPDHADHWASRPVINGINVRELMDPAIVVTDGRLVGF